MLFEQLTVRGYRSIQEAEVPLGPITVLIGPNNAGKSALLRAPYLFQTGAQFAKTDVRLGYPGVIVTMTTAGAVRIKTSADLPPQPENGVMTLGWPREGPQAMSLLPKLPAPDEASPSGGSDEPQVTIDRNGKPLYLAAQHEPDNLIYPVLSNRRQTTYRMAIDASSAKLVYHDDSYLAARVGDLASSDFAEGVKFRELCKRILGINIAVFTGENNSQLMGIRIDRYNEIPLEAMGAGLSSALNLIVGLSTAGRHLFLVEEPENDLHPRALKALLAEVVWRSTESQFIISTHSNIVLSTLGAIESTRVIEVSTDNGTPPTSSYRDIEGPHERLRVLQDLGYEFADFGLADGWLIFEESTAEFLANEWLIPTFAPRLRRLRTVAAIGVSRLRPMFQDIHEMFLFAHLGNVYHGRVWVITDGDRAGIQVVEELRSTYKNWEPDNFLHWVEDDFERYYPAEFSVRVENVLAMQNGQERKRAKGLLVKDVVAWIREDDSRARRHFESAASDVVHKLRHIEAMMKGLEGVTTASPIS